MITFANGQTFDAPRIYGEKKVYQGIERNMLEISISSADISFNEAKALWKNAEATAEITITANNKTVVLLNYSLPAELVVEMIKIDTDSESEVITLKFAQKSDLELALEAQAVDIQDTQVALMELAELVTA